MVKSAVGSIAAPGVFATLQSAAMGGYGTAVVHGVVQGVGALVSGGGVFASWYGGNGMGK
ncbi:hypothetical protein O9K51_01353 [Purpureocillium lavendulum]|uniref:Uncharacterized protein n=1 Tax=Purpureocillium lavendulum TaxID=1247861 RepID=A0AB34G8T3_9HYPO|nr:hypothetical protein O9K51_01353 [Purpureocillium lavendulum]